MSRPNRRKTDKECDFRPDKALIFLEICIFVAAIKTDPLFWLSGKGRMICLTLKNK